MADKFISKIKIPGDNTEYKVKPAVVDSSPTSGSSNPVSSGGVYTAISNVPQGTVTSVAVSNGGGLSVSGSPITSSGTITISHSDTSSQASVNNSGRTFIQDVTLDTYGHVTALGSYQAIGLDQNGVVYNLKTGNTTDEIFNDYSNNVAVGGYSHAEGTRTTADGASSHAEGNGSIADGDNSHAEGNHTKAYDDGSHAEGIGTIAYVSAQHAEGKYNVADANMSFVIGNGTGENARSDAFSVDWDGNIYTHNDTEGVDVRSIIAFGTCATADNQRAKVVTMDDNNWRRHVGCIIAVKFSNTNNISATSANPITLNVNGTGGANVYYNADNAYAGASPFVYGYAGRYTYYIWDGNYWVWVGCGTISPNDVGMRIPKGTTQNPVSVDDYIIPGEYYIGSNSDAGDIGGLPIANGGRIEVKSTLGSGYVIQVYYPNIAEPEIYIRRRTGGSSPGWGSWVKFSGTVVT